MPSFLPQLGFLSTFEYYASLLSTVMPARFQSLLTCTVLALVTTAYAGIGPIADLIISNAAISPDGYVRDAVVVNGQSPGPLITGKKART